MSLRANSASTVLDAKFILRMDRVCDDFEGAWRTGQRPRIEDLLDHFTMRERTEVIRELVRLERELRETSGETPLRAEYESRFPAVDLADVFEQTSPASPPTLRNHSREAPAIPGYAILERIGRGGMGVVYKARQLRLNRLVALKMIDGSLPSDEQLARFEQEAEAVALLQHPHIVQIHEVGEAGGRPFLALEFVDGETLAKRLGGEPQPPLAAAGLIELLARAMQVAHERGVVHRDLKPTNIMLVGGLSTNGSAANCTVSAQSASGARAEPTVWSLTSRLSAIGTSDVTRQYGTPKITDFGLAKRLDDDSQLTLTGVIVGTPSYMAPEQASGKSAQQGPAVDVYSLGAICYEMLTGRPPFKAPTSLETLELMRTTDPLPPTRLQPRVPRDLETICLKCLAKEPAARFATMGELADELSRFLNGEPIKTRSVSRLERAVKWARRHPAGASLIAVSLVMVVAFIGVWGAFTQRLREQRGAANSARVDAEKARDAAKISQTEAIRSKNDAVAARDEALLQKERARRITYAVSIQAVHQAWLDGDLKRMQRILDGPGCLPRQSETDFRNWEWHYLQTLLANGRQGVSCPLQPQENPDSPRESTGLHAVCFSPDGRQLVVSDWLAGCGVHVFDAESQTLIKTLTEHPRTVQVPLFSPDGKWLFTGGRVGAGSFLRDGSTREVRYSLPHPDNVYGACFSPDSRWLFTAAWDGQVRIWDVAHGELKSEWRAHHFKLHNVQISPDGQHLATCGQLGLVTLWEPDSAGIDRPWHEVAVLPGHTNQVSGLAFSPDSQMLATSCEAGEIRLWDVRERRLIAPLYGHRKWVYQLQFSPDGRWLGACCDDMTASLIDPKTFRVARRLRGHTHCVRGLAFSPDSKRLATVGLDRQLKLWDLTLTADEFDEFTPATSRKLDIALIPGTQLVATSCYDGKVHLWNRETLKLERSLDVRGEHEVTFLAASPQGRWLAATTVEYPPIITVWDCETWQVVRTLNGHTAAIRALEFSPDGQRLASCGYDSSVRIWDLGGTSDPVVIRDLMERHNAVCWLPDSRRLLIGGTANDLIEWDVGEHREIRRFSGHSLGILAINIFDKARKAAVASSETQVRIWNLETGQLELTVPGHAASISQQAVSADGQRLFTVSYDNTIRVWDLETGFELLSFSPQAEIEYAIEFDSESQTLFDSSARGSFRAWRTKP